MVLPGTAHNVISHYEFKSSSQPNFHFNPAFLSTAVGFNSVSGKDLLHCDKARSFEGTFGNHF